MLSIRMNYKCHTKNYQTYIKRGHNNNNDSNNGNECNSNNYSNNNDNNLLGHKKCLLLPAITLKSGNNDNNKIHIIKHFNEIELNFCNDNPFKVVGRIRPSI